MKKVTGSIVADNGSSIKNAQIGDNNNISISFYKKKSYWGGVISGILVSVIATGIWYLIEHNLLT